MNTGCFFSWLNYAQPPHSLNSLISTCKQSKGGVEVYSWPSSTKLRQWLPRSLHISPWYTALLWYLLCWARGWNEPHGGKHCGFHSSVQEFVIDMPCENAQKMYIGNAMHGNYAAVFAQLIIEGKSQGLLPTWLEEFSLLLLFSHQ